MVHKSDCKGWLEEGWETGESQEKDEPVGKPSTSSCGSSLDWVRQWRQGVNLRRQSGRWWGLDEKRQKGSGRAKDKQLDQRVGKELWTREELDWSIEDT